MSNADQPAFPCSYPMSEPRNPGWTGGGLTKREQFAAMAMQGLLANGLLRDLIEACKNTDEVSRAVAIDAVKHADALLAELAKGKP